MDLLKWTHCPNTSYIWPNLDIWHNEYLDLAMMANMQNN